MIPYDDLVVALAAWRARQGLPVVQVAGAPARPAGPPPAPRTAAAPRVAAQAPVAADDFGGDALVEDTAYDPLGEDYVVSLGTGVIVESAGESTAIGGPPEPVAEGVLVPKRGKRNPDW